jgi:hypothetical protein
MAWWPLTSAKDEENVQALITIIVIVGVVGP